MSSLHPIAAMLYFVLVLGFTMLLAHPVCLAVSLISAIGYGVYLKGRRAVRFSLLYMLPMLIIAAVLNPAFSHGGVTILAYLPSGNPLTLESILYGISSAAMLITVISWFSCFDEVMTSDKLVYLFGRIIPALSLILSMSLRFVPRFTAQIKVIAASQRCLGRDISHGSIVRRARYGVKILSILITWALENAIDTADSMKSRGYGLPGRTAFSIYRFTKRDRITLCFLLASAAVLITGAAFGKLKFSYIPITGGAPFDAPQFGLFAAYSALCACPLYLNVKEDAKWKVIASARQ
ncbi:MAG: energy-coupling factor transporter transmembrane protein EcfT [Oscillospiraceae bacterium]|jgi:energy-coupling factor transport system permease protein|nr:energy-coupling factor transporter transmembrane protein EcfT [Oscillospiraceae bacterium]